MMMNRSEPASKRQLQAYVLLLFGCLMGTACKNESKSTKDPEEKTCDIGSERCSCTKGDSCDDGLTCLSGLCVKKDAEDEGESDKSGDADTDTDTDSDTDGDTDTDADGDTDTDADTDADNDADSDTDTDADSDTDTDADTDTDTDPVTPYALVANAEGWIAKETNTLNIQGAWWTAADEEGSTIDMEVNTDGSVCAAGEATRVMGADYEGTWGAMLAFNLCAEDTETPEESVIHPLGDCPFNTQLASQFKGIRFDITGEWDTWDQDIRVEFDEIDNDTAPYITFYTDGTNRVALMEDAYVWYVELYDPPEDPRDYPARPEQVGTIQFHVPSAQFGDSDFNFCISNVEAITD